MNERSENVDRATDGNDALLGKALQDLLDHYVQLINSGDAGNWDPETETPVMQARAALRLTGAQLDPTREHLQKLVQRTADHWLRLQLTHPIAWEGAIDAAMEAACNEIRRLEKPEPQS